MKKKGIFYSIITLLFLVPIIFYTIYYLDIAGSQMEYSKTKMTGDKLSAFVDSIDGDLPRSLEIIGRQSIAASIIYIDSNGVPLDDAGKRITEAMMNSTIYGAPTNLSRSTLAHWADATISKGARYGFSTNISIRSINVTAYDSFHVLVSAEIAVNSTDSSGAMRLDKTYHESIPVSIEGFDDPVHILGTNGMLTRTIKQANITVSGADAVDEAVSQKLYITSSDGPSFLDRLEGSLTTSDKYRSQTANTIGIETFVYIPEISSSGIPVKSTQSMVDHYYFDSAAHAGSAVNSSAHGWLRLDPAHAGFYGVALVP